MELKQNITSLVEEKIAGSENFLVEVKVTPGKIIVIIDHPKGVKIEDCVQISRYLHEKLEESSTFEHYELEVGSPGMEEPLKVLRQYEKRIGQEVSVLTFDGIKRTGTLMSVNEEGVELNENITSKSGNKKIKQQILNNIPFTQIKETRVIFSFDKII
jgi:ribosome maturation factor RimP